MVKNEANGISDVAVRVVLSGSSFASTPSASRSPGLAGRVLAAGLERPKDVPEVAGSAGLAVPLTVAYPILTTKGHGCSWEQLGTMLHVCLLWFGG